MEDKFYSQKSLYDFIIRNFKPEVYAYHVIQLLQGMPAADVEPKQRWIPVTERLPEEKISPMTMDYTEYPCVFDDRSGQREVRYYKFGKGHFWHGPGCIDEYVTHWAEPMPLPEPPKEEEDGI